MAAKAATTDMYYALFSYLSATSKNLLKMFGFLKKPPIESKSNPAEDMPKKSGWISRLKSGLARTADQMSDLFDRGGKIDDDLYEELETILITADVGMGATRFLLAELRRQVKAQRLTEAVQ